MFVVLKQITNFCKDGMFLVQFWSLSQCDEKLACIIIWTSISHSDDTSPVES